jgi:hypothetical protein
MAVKRRPSFPLPYTKPKEIQAMQEIWRLVVEGFSISRDSTAAWVKQHTPSFVTRQQYLQMVDAYLLRISVMKKCQHL